ncbi:S-Ena type endospore appendage [Peribacillus simplex]|uniref:S-Ena type endospore appendage n=1 Tax=Peribacillus simplex TaxID=1478 RepID=UPI0011DCB505|nr:S-Ena type endospore appendage [Peribacillus simplex]
MCNSNGFNGSCCPPAQMFQEKICGNFNGTGAAQIVWTAPAGDYFEGTFQIFNSASSTGPVTGTINPGAVAVGPVPPGSTFSVAATNPTDFTITAPIGTSGTYCITLYKRVLA